MTRDLYVSTFPPTLGSGRAQRTYTCVRALAALGPVDLAYVAPNGEPTAPEYEAIDGLELHRIVPSRGARRAALYAAHRLRGVPSAFARGTTPEVVAAIERLGRRPGRGRVVVGDLAAATAALAFARSRPVIYNAHNVITGLGRRGLGDRTRVGTTITRRYERRLLNRAAESWMVSPADMAAAARIAPGARLRYVPNAVDVAAVRVAPARPPGGHRLLMVAYFGYAPNRAARDFLVDEVMPRVWAELPAARLTLVGAGDPEWSAPDRRVELAGFVDDLASAYHAADCVAVPLRDGGGSPLKFVEAMAYGVPVVATPYAARGLVAEPGEHFVAGADAAAFAAAVIGVLRDGAPAMAARARALAEETYSVEALVRHISGERP